MTTHVRIDSTVFIGLAAIAFVIVCGAMPEAYADESGNSDDEESITVDRDALDEFTREFVWSQSTILPGGATETAYYQGRHQRALRGANLYEAINQPELARSYRQRTGTRIALGVLGLTAAVVAIPLFLLGPGQESAMKSVTAANPFTTPVGLTSIGLVIGGYVAFGIGFRMDSHPIESHETRELIEEYNLDLLDRLEIERDQLPDDDDDMPDGDLYVSPYFNDDGGGLALQLTF